MTYTPDTTIKGESRGSADAIYAWAKQKGAKRLPDVRLYLDTMYKLCTTNNIRFEVLAAQSIHETTDVDTGAPWASYWWAQRCNPAGIGITGDPTQNNASRDFKTGDAAARAHFLHAFLYAVGTDIPSGVSKQDDPRYDAALSAGYAGIAPTIAGFTNRWGIDNNYANAWVGRLNALDAAGLLTGTTTPPQEDTTVSDTVGKIVDILKDVTKPATLTFGKVPMPGYVDRQAATANKPESIGWDNLGRRTPMFIVLHRMCGTLNSTDSFFPQASTQALTDYGIGTANVDGAASDGKIIQWNDPRGYRAGWSSGPVSAPSGDALKWIQWSGNRWGVSICNVCGVSIEHSGQYNDSMTDFAFSEDAKLVAYWLDQIGVHWDKAPLHPVTGISAVTWHQEWTIGTGKICPGPWLMNKTDDLIAAAAQIMKQYQTQEVSGGVVTPVPPVDQTPVPAPLYAAPQPIPALAKLGKQDKDAAQALVIDGQTRFVFVGDRVRATKTTPRLQYALADAKRVGPDLKAGEEFDVLWQLTADDGKEYYITSFWTRINVGDTERMKD